MEEENQYPLAVEMKQVTKIFGNFVANDHIDFDLRKGEIHALLGENGAGKSTLMNILYGLYSPTSGEIKINGNPVHFDGPKDAISAGLGMVHQHFMLIEPFTVVENIILGEEPTNGIVIDKKTAREKTMELSRKYRMQIDPDARIQNISVGMQQRVEILKAVYRKAEILIFDEPTAVLTPQEIDELMHILRAFADDGKSIILITHKLGEIKAIADRCTVIRRGQKIATVDVKEVNEAQLAEMMVGRQVNFSTVRERQEKGSLALEIQNLKVKDDRDIDRVDGLNLILHRGEILGLAGVDGNGQTELLEALTGLRHTESGKILIDGKIDIANQTPYEIRKAGVNNIPEDRNKRGLVGDFTVAENLILTHYEDEIYSKKGILQRENILSHAHNLLERYDIRPREPEYLARSLSGGNQQKIILAREIDDNPEILIASQPTRGLDVGAIEYIHKFLVDQRNQGKAILLISFELDEIMNLSDRIAVIYEGQIADILEGERANERELGLLMAGGGNNEK